MVTALARELGPVALLCLGDPELPAHQREGDVEILRLPSRYRDVLDRATAFAQFVSFHAKRMADSLELAVFRDPWGGMPAMRAVPAVPAIFEVNALPTWELAYSRPGFAAGTPLAAKIGDMERFCLRSTAMVLTVSPVTQDALLREGVEPERMTLIRNTAPELFFRANESKEARSCIYVGGLQPWQGVEFLIESFGLASVPDARLRIIHSGNRDARHLERLIIRRGLDESVTLEPPQAVDDLAATLSSARFSVAPLTETARNTLQGCCPIKIVESMAAGTPVLASDLAVCRDLIRHGEDGLLAPAGDRRRWALAIRRLFADDTLCATLAGAARQSAYANFCQANAHERLRSVFRRTAKSPGVAA